MSLITKARKPAWQRGRKPSHPQQRTAWKFSAKHEQKFSRAYLKFYKQMIGEDIQRAAARAIEKHGMDPMAVVNAMPFLDPEDPRTFLIWLRFSTSLEKAYEDIITDTIDQEIKDRGWDVRSPIAKAESTRLDAREFINKKTRRLAVETSNTERARIRQIVQDGVEGGAGTSQVVKEIKDTIGLTRKQVVQVRKQTQAAFASGASVAKVNEIRLRSTDRILRQRAATIARTETIQAQMVGLTNAWKAANDQGILPPSTRKMWVATIDEVTSDICDSLDGQVVGINEQFDGGFDSPPAHPNCRSVMRLVT